MPNDILYVVIWIVSVLLVVGIVLWLINNFLTIVDPRIKQLINGVILLGAVIFVIYLLFGLVGGCELPRHHRW